MSIHTTDTDSSEYSRQQHTPEPPTSEAGVSVDQYHTLLARREAALDLPPNGETWTLTDRDGLDNGDLTSFSMTGLIEAVGVASTGCKEWQTKPGVYAWVERHLRGQPRCPGAGCFATGVRCLEAGERYTCTAEDCSATFDRDTAEQLLAGEPTQEGNR